MESRKGVPCPISMEDPEPELVEQVLRKKRKRESLGEASRSQRVHGEMVTASWCSPPVYVNEDVAIIILRHLADEYYHGPNTHWIRIRGVSKAFNRAVLRYLSKIVSVGLKNSWNYVEVTQCIKNGGNENCTRTLFENKNAAVAYLRCLAKHVEKPIAVDIKYCTAHSEDGELIDALCSFRAIKSIKRGVPACKCLACENLVEHAGPGVDISGSPITYVCDSDCFTFDDDYSTPRYSSDDYDDSYDDSDSHDEDDYDEDDY